MSEDQTTGSVIDVRQRDASEPNGPVALLTGSPADAETTEVPIVTEAPAARSSRRPHRRGGRRGLAGGILLGLAAAVAGFVLFVAFLSAFPQARAQAGLQRHFKYLLANSQAPIGGVIPAGIPVARLDIPSIGLEQIVVEGTAADQLRKGPGHLSVSPLPGQIGNSVLAAHALAYGGPFGDIGTLRDGSIIKALTGDGPSEYVVTGHRVVSGKNTQAFDATPDNRLTLVTTSSAFSTSRLVVTARLVTKAYDAPNGRPSVLPGSEAGLAGGGGAGPALLLFGELALVAAVITVFGYRRLSRWSSYLITTPILLASLWLLYGTIGRLLPATL